MQYIKMFLFFSMAPLTLYCSAFRLALRRTHLNEGPATEDEFYSESRALGETENGNALLTKALLGGCLHEGLAGLGDVFFDRV